MKITRREQGSSGAGGSKEATENAGNQEEPRNRQVIYHPTVTIETLGPGQRTTENWGESEETEAPGIIESSGGHLCILDMWAVKQVVKRGKKRRTNIAMLTIEMNREHYRGRMEVEFEDGWKSSTADARCRECSQSGTHEHR